MKTIKIMFLAIFAIFLIGIGFAEPEVLYKDLLEVSAFNNEYGGEVRFLELEQDLTDKIIDGNLIIEEINVNYPSFDTTRLEEIITELDSLLVEVQSIDMEENTTYLSERYLEIKAESRDLITKFRQTVSEVISDEAIKNSIKEQIQNQEKEQVKALESEIQKKKNEYNALQFQSKLALLGLSNPEAVQQIKSGTATVEGAKTFLNEAYSKMSGEEKETAAKRVIEEAVSTSIQNKALDTELKVKVESTFENKNEEPNSDSAPSSEDSAAATEATGSESENPEGSEASTTAPKEPSVSSEETGVKGGVY